MPSCATIARSASGPSAKPTSCPQFDHAGIVSVYGRVETSDGELWIALQYVDGTDAEEALRAAR